METDTWVLVPITEEQRRKLIDGKESIRDICLAAKEGIEIKVANDWSLLDIREVTNLTIRSYWEMATLTILVLPKNLKRPLRPVALSFYGTWSLEGYTMPIPEDLVQNGLYQDLQKRLAIPDDAFLIPKEKLFNLFDPIGDIDRGYTNYWLRAVSKMPESYILGYWAKQ